MMQSLSSDRCSAIMALQMYGSRSLARPTNLRVLPRDTKFPTDLFPRATMQRWALEVIIHDPVLEGLLDHDAQKLVLLGAQRGSAETELTIDFLDGEDGVDLLARFLDLNP